MCGCRRPPISAMSEWLEWHYNAPVDPKVLLIRGVVPVGPQRYRFGELAVDVANRRLWRGCQPALQIGSPLTFGVLTRSRCKTSDFTARAESADAEEFHADATVHLALDHLSAG